MKQIPLTQGKFALVDDEDFEYLSQWKWNVSLSKKGNTGYAVRSQRYGRIKISICMHRLIMGLENGDKRQVDHIDHDGLNNQKQNLRACTAQENQRNTTSRKNSSSKYLGVRLQKRKLKKTNSERESIQARIRIHGKLIHLGCFNTEEAAALAYNEKALELFGEFANLNVVEA